MFDLLGEARRLPRSPGHSRKAAGIAGEVADEDAARLLGGERTPTRQAGYDAVERRDGKPRKPQSKARCLLHDAKPGQRLGSIRTPHEWDALLVTTPPALAGGPQPRYLADHAMQGVVPRLRGAR